MASISKNAAITFSSGIVIFIIGLITSIIIARVLGPEGQGIYSLILLFPTIILLVGSLGIEAANVYFTGSKKYEIKDILSNSLLIGIILGAALIFLFFMIFQLNIFQDFIHSNNIKPIYLWLIVLTIPASLIFGFIRSTFLGQEKIVLYNKLNILQTSLQFLGVFVLLILLKQGVFGAVLSYLITTFIILLIVILLIAKITKLSLKFNKKLSKDAIKYGVKCYFGNIAQFLNYRLDMFLVAIFLNTTAVGFYGLAVGIAEKLWMLPGAISTVLFPRISSLNDEKANDLTPKVARNTFFITFMLSLVLLVISTPVIRILFGSAFLPSVVPLLILLPGIIALAGAKTLTADLAGRGKPQYGTYAAFISLGVTIPLDIWLIPKWGISGAAFASSVAYSLTTIIIIIAFSKVSKKPWTEICFIKIQDLKEYWKVLIKSMDKIGLFAKH